MAKNKLDLRPLIKDFKKARRRLPAALGNRAVRFFRQGFINGGFTDRTLSPWKKRKKSTIRRYEREGINYTKGRPLNNSGDLLRSVQRISTTFSRIKIGTKGLKYANIHNEGGNGLAWGKHPFSMPKRMFIGKSFVLEKKLKKRIEKEIIIFTKNAT